MKKIFTFSIITVLILTSSSFLFGQSEKDNDYANKKAQFWNEYQIYKSNIVGGNSAVKPADPYGLFFIDANNNFQVKNDGNSTTFIAPWINTFPDAASSGYAWSQSTGTYTSISGTGTLIAAPGWDDGNYGPFNIGFTFSYDNLPYTQFCLNANGFVAPGSVLPTSSYEALISGSTNEIIACANEDLQGYTGTATTGIYYQTTGSAPNRVLTVEWKDACHYNQYGDTMNFQIKFFETSNAISLNFGSFYRSQSSYTSVDCGLRGTSNADTNARLVTSSGSWSNSDRGNPCYISPTVIPSSGLIWTWAPVPMTYSSCNTIQLLSGIPVFSNTSNVQIIQVQVVTDGIANPLNITSFNLGTNGSTNPGTDISNAKMYFTGNSNGFSTATLFGTAVSPNGTFTINGSQQLSGGTNYFWLTYDIPGTATIGDTLDAQCNTITVADTSRIPTVTAPAGNRIILGAALCGTKTIPGDYPNFAAAITALNTYGVCASGVTINVAAGFVDTAANLVITSSGSSTGPVIFQKSGSGANPLIVAGVGTSTTLDGIIKFSGADYITFDGIDLQENDANTTTTTQMEWGYALLKVDGTNGCQNNTIKNCKITLNKTNTNTKGIYAANHTISSTGTLTLTAFSGTNSSNKFFNNQIQNCYTGIYVYGYSATSPYDLYDHFNQIGLQGGNTVRNFGGTSTATYGIYTAYQDSLSVSNNDVAGGTNSTGAIYGLYIYYGYNSSVDIYNNTVSDTTSATTSAAYGIYVYYAGYQGVDNTVNIKRNTVQGMTSTATTSGALYGYYLYYIPAYQLNVDSNKFVDNKWGGETQTATGAIYGFYIYPYTTAPLAGSVENITNNYISGNKRTQSTASSGTTYGMYIYYGNETVNAYNNIIENDTLMTTSTSSYYMYVYNYYATNVSYHDNIIRNVYKPLGAATLYGIYISNAAYAGTFNYYNNSTYNIKTAPGIAAALYPQYNAATSVTKNIYGNLSRSIYSSLSGAVYGIYTSGGTTVNVYKNTVTDLRTSTGYGYGLTIGSGTTVNVYNNMISDIRCDSISTTLALMGLYLSGGTTINAYYNSVYLNSISTGASFGTAAIYASTSPNVDMRNNIAVNVSTPGASSGNTVAYYRSSATLTTYATISDNNCFYAGTPAPNKLLYYDPSNSIQDINSYKTFMSPREANSISENPPFINVSTTPYDLHISSSIQTGIESGGTPITSPIVVNTDYDDQTRNATTPDIGADEGNFLYGDLVPPTVAYTPLENTTSTANRTLDATITDNHALQNTPPNDPRIYYKKGANGTYRFGNKTSQIGNVFTFTIHSDSLGIVLWDTVFYYVAAQDVGTPPLNPNVATNPSGGSGYNPPGTVPPPAPNFYIIVTNPMSGVFSIPGDYPTIAAAIGDMNLRGISGPCTFNVAQNHVEVASNIELTTTGTAAKPIVFQKAVTSDVLLAGNPAVVAAPGTGTMDGIIILSGADYVTFDGIDVRDTSANTTTTEQMEWGYALLKADGTNGSQNITIKNCSITLDRTNTATYGIYSANHTTSSTSQLSVTAFSGTNSNNKFYNNQIQNCYSGIYIAGYSDVSPYSYFDHFNQVGVQGANTIRNYGGGAVSSYGIYTVYQDSLAVNNNDIAGGTGTTGALYGMLISTAYNASVLLYNNTISDTTVGSGTTYGIALSNSGYSGTDNTVIVKRNTVLGMTSTGATSGALYGYYIYYTTSMNLYIDSNKFIDNKWGGSSQTATGTIYGFYIYPYTTAPVSGSAEYITNNYMSGNKRTQSTTSSGTLYGMYIYYGNQTVNAYNNIIENDTLSTTTSTSYYMYVYNYYATSATYYGNIIRNIYKPAGTGGIYGYYISNAAYNGTFDYYSNTANNIKADGVASTIYGIYNAATSVTKNAYSNSVYSLQTSLTGSVYGIYQSGGTTLSMYRNSVYNLSTESGYGYGMYISSGTTNHVYNNYISEIKATSSTYTPAVNGIYISGGTTDNIFYNTIYLDAVSTSATTFGSAGIYASTSPTVDMRDNIVVNVSTPGPTGGFTVAYQRSSTTLTTYSANSNNNCFYAGTPGTNRLIHYDGTNSYQTIEEYQALVTPRDNYSFSENPPFVNITTPPYNLHISTSVPTYVESHGTPINSPIVITTDYDNDTRNATTPDVGADEGNFLGLSLPVAPQLVSPPNGAINQPLALNCVWTRPLGMELMSKVKTLKKENKVGVLDGNQNNANNDSKSILGKESVANEVSKVLLGKQSDELETIYKFWFDLVTDTTSMANLLRDTSVVDTTKSLSGLSAQTSYFWRVRAKNAVGWGNYSVWFKFTTMSQTAMVNLKVIPGGFYSTSINQLNMKDTIRIILVDSATCTKVDSARSLIDSVTFNASPTPTFSIANTGKYYIYVYHRNHLPISSRYTQQVTRGSTVSYDFTTDSIQTYGFNVIKVSTSPVLWGMIPGDANADEYVDGLDQVIWINENGQNGYFASDFNGDTYVDGLDQVLWILYNGSSSYLPCATIPTTPEKMKKNIEIINNSNSRLIQFKLDKINNQINNQKDSKK